MDFTNLKKKLDLKSNSILSLTKYQTSSVLVPIIKENDEDRFLFQKRSKKVRQGGEVCFPGGYYDSKTDTSFKKTAIRETCEELGIKKNKIKLLGSMGILITPMGMLINIFVGCLKINHISSLQINKQEVDCVFSLPVSFFQKTNPSKYHVSIQVNSTYSNEKGEKITVLPAKKLGLPKRYHESWNGNNYPVLLYNTEFGPIWGITAEIIHELVKIIR